jgi:hypothetical protein
VRNVQVLTPSPFETSARIDWDATASVFGEHVAVRVETGEHLQLAESLVTVKASRNFGRRGTLETDVGIPRATRLEFDSRGAAARVTSPSVTARATAGPRGTNLVLQADTSEPVNETVEAIVESDREVVRATIELIVREGLPAIALGALVAMRGSERQWNLPIANTRPDIEPTRRVAFEIAV